MNDLVKKASTAYINAYGKTLMTFDERHLEAMTAAAKVLLEAALGEGKPFIAIREEWDSAFKEAYNPENPYQSDQGFRALLILLANRKNCILGPKTIESRIAEHLDAFLPLETFQARDNAIKQLARELVGLIAEMKGEK